MRFRTREEKRKGFPRGEGNERRDLEKFPFLRARWIRRSHIARQGPSVMAMLLSTCARLYRGEIVPLIIVTVRVRGQLSDCRGRCSSSCPECRGSNRPRIGRSIKSGTIRVIIRLLMTLTRGRNEFERAEQCIINVPFSQCKFRGDSLGGALA